MSSTKVVAISTLRKGLNEKIRRKAKQICFSKYILYIHDFFFFFFKILIIFTQSSCYNSILGHSLKIQFSRSIRGMKASTSHDWTCEYVASLPTVTLVRSAYGLRTLRPLISAVTLVSKVVSNVLKKPLLHLIKCRLLYGTLKTGLLHHEISGDAHRLQDYTLNAHSLVAANLFAANP